MGRLSWIKGPYKREAGGSESEKTDDRDTHQSDAGPQADEHGGLQKQEEERNWILPWSPSGNALLPTVLDVDPQNCKVRNLFTPLNRGICHSSDRKPIWRLTELRREEEGFLQEAALS